MAEEYLRLKKPRGLNTVLVATVSVFSLIALTVFFYSKATEAERLREFIQESESKDEKVVAFHNFISDFGRDYRTFSEYDYRFDIFREHFRFINDFNARPDETYKLAVNYFADITDEEFRAMFLGHSESFQHDLNMIKTMVQPDLQLLQFVANNSQEKDSGRTEMQDIDNSTFNFPEEMNWAKDPTVVSPVQWQGHCGGCWSFSAVGALEGAYGLSYNTAKKFSEQQILDCTGGYYGTSGCDGGLSQSGLAYAQRFGVMLLEDYEYVFTEGNCRFESKKVAYKPKAFHQVPPENNLAVMYQLTKQPLAIAIDADGLEFRFYKSGVYRSDDSPKNLDHAVLIVGYGHEPNPTDPDVMVPYYLLKNSWNTTWGEEGYMKIYRIMDIKTPGTNGILQQVYYPAIEKQIVKV